MLVAALRTASPCVRLPERRACPTHSSTALVLRSTQGLCSLLPFVRDVGVSRDMIFYRNQMPAAEAKCLIISLIMANDIRSSLVHMYRGMR